MGQSFTAQNSLQVTERYRTIQEDFCPVDVRKALLVSESAEELLSRAHDILDVVARLENRHHSPADIEAGWGGIDRALAYAEATIRRLAVLNDQEWQPGRAPERLALLIAEVSLLRNQIMTSLSGERSEIMHKANQALQRLRLAGNEQEFSEMLSVEVVNLGFVRAMYTTVSDMRWMTKSVATINGESERERLLTAGQQPPFRELRGLFEFEMVQQRTAMLQRGIRKSRRVHPEIIRITESESYTSAPLVAGPLVMGFMSVDVNITSGTVDEFDRDLLALFCGGAGIALEHIRTMESVADLRMSVEQGLASLHSITQGTAARASPSPSAGSDNVSGREAFVESGLITRRELQVLKLIAHGRSNGDIGRQLHISEGTAKTHVRNILRKLGVTNRTQAAEIYRQQT